MIEPSRTEWQVRCAFNAFCKRVLKNEAIEHGNTYWGMDEETRDRLRSKLMQSVLAFKM